MSLTDQDTGVVDRLGQAELEDLSLQSSFQEIFNLETETVIELGLGLIKHTDTNQTTNQRVALEETTGILFIEGEKLTSSTTDLGEGETC